MLPYDALMSAEQASQNTCYHISQEHITPRGAQNYGDEILSRIPYLHAYLDFLLTGRVS